MPINTKNAGALTGAERPRGDKVWVRMLKVTHVHSAGRDTVGGEELEVSAEDARYLVAKNKAERIQRPSVQAAADGITLTGTDAAESSGDTEADGITLTGTDAAESSGDTEADGITLTGTDAVAEETPEESGRRFRRRRSS